jgi:hypothetical protein
MPKKYGLEEKDQVVAHIPNLVLTGKLRGGDRVDRRVFAASDPVGHAGPGPLRDSISF